MSHSLIKTAINSPVYATMQTGNLNVDNIDLENEELAAAIQNYNKILPKGQACMKVLK